jgi:predicted nucleic acid-binding protein
LLVTATVWREVTCEPRVADRAMLTAAFERGQLIVVDDPVDVPAALTAVRLDAGERSALALALLREAVVLVDERRGRACAAELGLAVLGTLGLLIRAHERGLIGRVRPLTDALLDSGYFLARPLVDRALASIGE